MANKRIVIIGLWHLGCVYAASLAKMGFEVYGFDADKKVIDDLKRGVPPIFEPDLAETIARYLDRSLHFTQSTDVLPGADYIFVTHDVAVDAQDRSNIAIVKKTFDLIRKHAGQKATIVISSQIPVGTSRTLVRSLKKRGIDESKVIYFPENLRLGKGFASFLTPDRIILGSDSEGAMRAFQKDFRFKCPVITMGLESAEMVKHALNGYLATCISFSSELSDLSEKTGANMLDVVKALKSDRRVSPYAPLNPGLGFAGGTLGRDVQALRKIAREVASTSRVFDAVYKVNQERLPRLISKIQSVYPALKGKNVGILGLTYTANTNTLRRSMSLELATVLKRRRANVRAYDPAIRASVEGFSFMTICEDLVDFFSDLDLVILMTEWPDFREIDLPSLSARMRKRVVVDAKNFLDPVVYRQNGFTYSGMGMK